MTYHMGRGSQSAGIDSGSTRSRSRGPSGSYEQNVRRLQLPSGGMRAKVARGCCSLHSGEECSLDMDCWCQSNANTSDFPKTLSEEIKKSSLWGSCHCHVYCRCGYKVSLICCYCFLLNLGRYGAQIHQRASTTRSGAL